MKTNEDRNQIFKEAKAQLSMDVLETSLLLFDYNNNNDRLLHLEWTILMALNLFVIGSST